MVLWWVVNVLSKKQVSFWISTDLEFVFPHKKATNHRPEFGDMEIHGFPTENDLIFGGSFISTSIYCRAQCKMGVSENVVYP